MKHVSGPKSCQDCPQSILYVIQDNTSRKEFTCKFWFDNCEGNYFKSWEILWFWWHFPRFVNMSNYCLQIMLWKLYFSKNGSFAIFNLNYMLLAYSFSAWREMDESDKRAFYKRYIHELVNYAGFWFISHKSQCTIKHACTKEKVSCSPKKFIWDCM